jgi:hypothetical protein
MKRGIEGPVLDAEDVARNLLHPLSDRVAVHGAAGGKSPKHEQVERSLKLVFAIVAPSL